MGRLALMACAMIVGSLASISNERTANAGAAAPLIAELRTQAAGANQATSIRYWRHRYGWGYRRWGWRHRYGWGYRRWGWRHRYGYRHWG
jgi:hypothetical protein